MLFPAATALAAQRVTAEQLLAMHHVVDELEAAVDPAEVARLQRDFQALVGAATGNETLSSILVAIQIRDENLRRAWLTSPKRRAVALEHDRMLLDAFERRDSEMARSIATVRVDTREHWIETLRSGGPPRTEQGAADERSVEAH